MEENLIRTYSNNYHYKPEILERKEEEIYMWWSIILNEML